MQLAEAHGVGGLGVFEVANGALAEEETKHGANRTTCDWQASSPGGFHNPSGEALGDGFQSLVGAGLLQQLQGFDPSCHGEGVAAEGARLIHGARWSHHRHDVGPAAVGPHR